jgi:hypothetical protein
MNSHLIGPAATVAIAPKPSASPRRALESGADFRVDLDTALTPAEARALAESFGALKNKSAPTDTRGRHIDLLA